MDPIGAITGNSDNLYKFLCINGLLLFLISVFYPLNKKNEIDLIRLQTEHQKEIFNYQTKKIIKDINSLTNELESSNVKILELRKKQKNERSKFRNYENEINQIKQNINVKNDSLKIKFNNQNVKKIELESQEKKIKKLQEQSQEYNTIYEYSKWFGIVFFITGFIWWIIVSVRKEKK